MKIYIARHGRTNYNDLNLCNGDPSVDVHLTEVGARQAQELAAKLKDKQIDRIWASKMPRTRQTAEIVNQFHDVPIEINVLLNDHRSGYEGRDAQLLMEALDAADDKWTARFNGGESIEDMKQRIAAFIDELKTRSDDAVLIVTSGWVIRMMVAVIENISNEAAWTREPKQGTYLEFDIV